MKKSFIQRLLGTVAVCAVVSINAQAADLKPAEAADQLHQLLSDMKSLHANFEQWVRDGKQTTLQHNEGTLWLQRPGLFRWETEEPFPQEIVSDGEYLWIYDEDLEQATRRTLDKQVGNTPALLLSGDPGSLQKNFTITGYRFDESGEIRFDLRPKGEDAMFTLLRVHFLDRQLRDMYLEDSLGQSTRIAFEIKSRNKKLKSRLFKLDLDDSVDIIKES